MIAITTALRKISNIRKKIAIIQGGARAGKTYAILLLLIDYALTNQNKRIGIFSFSYPHLQRGAINDFLQILKELQLFNKDNFNATKHIYKFDSGTSFEFITADQVGNVLGTQFDFTFVNECRLMPFEYFNQILMRTITRCYADFNPTSKFYIHDLIKRKDCEFLKLTYKDNEACPSGIIDEFKNIAELAKTSNYWANYAKVYLYGEIGGSVDAVFPDWRVAKIPDQAKMVSIGIDFGFTNDETAIIAVYYADNAYYLKELAFGKMMRTTAIANNIMQYSVPVFCDAAEPRTIDELNTLLKKRRCHGVKFNIIESINRINEEIIYIEQSSSGLMDEQMNYIYKRDKFTGELTNDPIGINNHRMDASRYGLCGYFSNKKRGVYQKNF